MSDWLSMVIAVTGVLTSGLLAYLAYSLNRQSARANSQRSIGILYDQLMNFRAAHPEVMRLCYQWKRENHDLIYRQATEEDREWALYYTYVEYMGGFVNAVLYGRKNRLLDRLAYDGHYEPLVKLLLTEHYPFIASSMQNVYLSALIREYVQQAERAGWNWEEKHKALIGPVPFSYWEKKKRKRG
jgi:hypothetical protein